MVKKLYLEDTFLDTVDAKITQIGSNEHGFWLTLDQTIFHPQGGGQPSDKGTINGAEVLGLFEDGKKGEIYHFISESDIASMKVGQQVSLNIDLTYRLECGALHTAGHLLAAVVEANYPLKTTKANQFPSQCSYEFKKIGDASEFPDKDTMKNDLEYRVKEDLTKNLPVTIFFDTVRNRSIQIGEYPEAPCGGTHLSNTAMIDAETFALRYVRYKKGTYKIGYDASYAHDVDVQHFPSLVEHKEKLVI